MIPRNAHFIWLGRDFHWVFALAIKSAAMRGGFETVTLHHDSRLEDLESFAALSEEKRIITRWINPMAYLRNIQPFGYELAELYARIGAPAGRANILRAAVLYEEGGVYLDTDTLTLASFEPLFLADFFCGSERIALPNSVIESKNPAVWVATGARLAARDFFRRCPGGWRPFKKIEHMYPMVVNNAILGAKPGHPLVSGLLTRMIEMPKKKQLRRFALGSRLLEQEIARYNGDGLVILSPEKFYPLAPEISEHWFRLHKKPDTRSVVTSSTVVVHWYASVRTKAIVPSIDPHYIRLNADNQLFSALAVGFV